MYILRLLVVFFPMLDCIGALTAQTKPLPPLPLGCIYVRGIPFRYMVKNPFLSPVLIPRSAFSSKRTQPDSHYCHTAVPRSKFFDGGQRLD